MVVRRTRHFSKSIVSYASFFLKVFFFTNEMPLVHDFHSTLDVCKVFCSVHGSPKYSIKQNVECMPKPCSEFMAESDDINWRFASDLWGIPLHVAVVHWRGRKEAHRFALPPLWCIVAFQELHMYTRGDFNSKSLARASDPTPFPHSQPFPLDGRGLGQSVVTKMVAEPMCKGCDHWHGPSHVMTGGWRGMSQRGYCGSVYILIHSCMHCMKW